MGTPAIQRLNWKKLGERIKEIRQQRGWNQRQAAAVVGRSQPDLSTAEHGQLQLTVEALSTWADAIGLSLYECCELLLHQDKETAIPENEAAEVLAWTPAKVRKHRKELDAWQDDAGRWVYSSYAVHRQKRRELAREKFELHGWDTSELP